MVSIATYIVTGPMYVQIAIQISRYAFEEQILREGCHCNGCCFRTQRSGHVIYFIGSAEPNIHDDNKFLLFIDYMFLYNVTEKKFVVWGSTRGVLITNCGLMSKTLICGCNISSSGNCKCFTCELLCTPLCSCNYADDQIMCG